MNDKEEPSGLTAFQIRRKIESLREDIRELQDEISDKENEIAEWEEELQEVLGEKPE